MNRAACIASLGTTLTPEVITNIRALFHSEQSALMSLMSPVASDIAYGPLPRQQLDLYAPDNAQPMPVLLFVHGGGFVQGDKGGATQWPNAHIGRWAARNGMIGAVMNYRLVPDAAWPSGGEDVAAAVGWLRANIAHYGGDPARIILMGTSAGAVHLGTWLMHAQTSKKLEGVNGIILLSGLYGYTPLDERDTPYYGAQADYTSRMPCAAIEHTQLPLFIARAEYDPPRFQTEFDAMVADRTRHPILPTTKFVAAGHNHYSIALHIGTGEIDGDHALSDALRGFIAPLVR